MDNKAHNVIPAKAKAQFNIRYNNFHTANSLKKKKKIKLLKNVCKRSKCKFKIEYIANGDSFLTKPEKTFLWQKNNKKDY